MIKIFTTDRGTLTVYKSTYAYIGALITGARQWTQTDHTLTRRTRVVRIGR